MELIHRSIVFVTVIWRNAYPDMPLSVSLCRGPNSRCGLNVTVCDCYIRSMCGHETQDRPELWHRSLTD